MTFKAAPNLDKKHTVFGRLVGGEDVLDALERLPRKEGTERPAKPVRITEVVMYVFITPHRRFVNNLRWSRSYQDPFEEYKTRLAKKLAKRAETEQNGNSQKVPEKKEGDDVNWFGTRVGTNSTIFGSEGGTGVGKYLNTAKRPSETLGSGGGGTEEVKKKRKIGFGNFEGW